MRGWRREARGRGRVMRCWHFVVLAVLWVFAQSTSDAQTEAEILSRMKSRYQEITEGLKHLQYEQEVRSWRENKKGKQEEGKALQMIVRPGKEADFKIRDPKGNWIDGGTPDHRLAWEGRQFQRTEANVSLPILMERYDFKKVSEDSAWGEPCWVMELTPKVGIPYNSRLEKVMTHLQGRMWVSQSKAEMVRLEATLAKPLEMAWAFATMTQLQFHLETVETPAGRAIAGYHLSYELDTLMDRSWRFQEVRMGNYGPRVE